ncbi:hypothetical protein [Exiguobacterium sp.]|uniref:hypothetical protein n=1 Tax=Exiguobacterium sp. TaxID=44751 RepID=UPI00263B1027|nr:hypothetical protein [Exiguobacterium sp.]MCC5892713.1 hypothetical protein [Exiguobacterium sp.]
MGMYQGLKIQLFDWRYQRLLGYIPLVFFCLTLFMVTQREFGLNTAIQIVHALYLPWIAWSAILYFQPLHDTGAYYALIHHYRKWFGFNFIFLLTLYVSGYSILILSIDGAFRLIQTYPIIVVHHLLLLTLYWMIGAGLILLLKSFEYAAALVLAYTLIEVVTRGEFMPWPHIFYFNEFYGDPMYVQKIGMLVTISFLFLVLTLIRLFKRV